MAHAIPSVGRTYAPALLRALAVVLLAVPFAGALAGGGAALWATTLASAALLAATFLLTGPARARAEQWSTPVDRLVLAGLVLSALQAVESQDAGPAAAWLRQVLACAMAFYALHTLARHTPGASDALWGVFGVAALGLGLHALWASAGGLARLAEWSEAADRAWTSRFGLGKALLLATIVAAGRAREPGAHAAWRVAACAGALGLLPHLALGGLGLGAAPLARLEQPLYFSVTVVAMLLLATLAKRAWQLRRERPGEAWRWRGLALGFLALAGLAILGGGSGGEGVRMLAALGAVATLVAAEEPAAAAGLDAAGLEDDHGAPEAAPEARRAA